MGIQKVVAKGCCPVRAGKHPSRTGWLGRLRSANPLKSDKLPIQPVINRVLRIDFWILDNCRPRASRFFAGAAAAAGDRRGLFRLQRFGGIAAVLAALLLGTSVAALPPQGLRGETALRRFGDTPMRVSIQNQSLAQLAVQVADRVGQPVIVDRTVDGSAAVTLPEAGPTAGAVLMAAAAAAGQAAMPIGDAVVIGPPKWLDRLTGAAAAAPPNVSTAVLAAMVSKLDHAAAAGDRPPPADPASLWIRLWQHRVTLQQSDRGLQLVRLGDPDSVAGDEGGAARRSMVQRRWSHPPAGPSAAAGEVVFELRMIEQPAGGALSMLAQRLGRPLRVDPGAGEALGRPVTLTLPPQSIEGLIRAVAAAAGVTVEIGEDEISVTH